MLKKIILSLPLLLLVSCEIEGNLTSGNLAPDFLSEEAVLLYNGLFVPTSGISVTGSAKIYVENNVKKVVLENFSVSNGPDLKVYLSKNPIPHDFVNLGNLSSAAIYPIPQQIDVAQYNYVLIHCQQYNHLFAVAALN